MSWTQPICLPCWYGRNSGVAPVQLREWAREEERCCICGQTTAEGVYIRIDPTTVAHPRP